MEQEFGGNSIDWPGNASLDKRLLSPYARLGMFTGSSECLAKYRIIRGFVLSPADHRNIGVIEEPWNLSVVRNLVTRREKIGISSMTPQFLIEFIHGVIRGP